TSAIIITLLRELLEILHVAGRHVGPELQHQIALARLDDGDFLGGRLRVRFLFVLFRSVLFGVLGLLGGRRGESRRQTKCAKQYWYFHKRAAMFHDGWTKSRADFPNCYSPRNGRS